jgi:LAS superfamily LD-carboxypeptidase LdcB
MKKALTPIRDVHIETSERVAKPKPSHFHVNFWRVFLITIATAVVFGTIYWSYITMQVNEDLARTQRAFASSTASFLGIIRDQKTVIDTMNQENIGLNNILTAEQKRRLELESLKATADKQIDTLTKLTTIDPELIKKYSKVYFLNDNYAPPKLKDIDAAYLTDPLKPAQVLENIYPFLMNMLKDADNQQVHILVVSAYRSFEYQKTLKSDYKVIYGAGTANQFSADQGYSEHQLGTALDLGTTDVPTADLPFQNTTAFKWLNDNAYKYGFVISYPKANKFYQYEPWHWRFVGRQLALDLHNQGKYFYEMDQREIDAYLIKLFD